MFYIVAILVLCVLIFVHELGHFLVAKWNNVAVLAFSIGFGPIIWKHKVRETTYSLRLFPLGGFVRMLGDDPRDLDQGPQSRELPALEEEERSKEEIQDEEERRLFADRSRWFLTKGFWPKFWIVFAGPLFNLIFAFLLGIALVYMYGEAEPDLRPVIGDVAPSHPAERAGIRSGDFVRMINGREMKDWSAIAETVRSSGGKEMVFTINRTPKDGPATELELKVTAEPDSSGLVNDEERKVGDVYRIGIGPNIIRTPAGLGRSVVSGGRHIWFITTQTWWGIKGLIMGSISAKHIAGPISIFKEAGRNAERGLDSLFGFMIFLSVSLAILNLLPIPVLDGGHILFFIIEALKGSPVSLKVREFSQQVGMALLLALMLFAVGNDLWR